MSEETVSLLGRLFGRRSEDLDAALRLARGEDVGEDSMRRLQRAGVLRRRVDGRPGLLPSLLAPLLALEESIADGGRRLLSALQRRLRRSDTNAERESVLEAMFEELSQQRRRLREMGVAGTEEDLLPVLRELRQTLDSLDPGSADPGLVMGTATLAAELIEMIGRELAPRRRKAKEPGGGPSLRAVTTAQLAGLVISVPRLIRPLKIPDVIELAAALQGDLVPMRTAGGSATKMPEAPDRRAEARAAIRAADPLLALYGGQITEEVAFERHAALAVLGRKGLAEAALVPALGARRLGGVTVTELAEELIASEAPDDMRVVA